MHYRHSYHAGNFADVFKHVVLCALLRALSRKDKPWACLETHAGAGAYDLAGEGAARTGEWRDGIGRLRDLGDVPSLLRAYLDIVDGLNGTGTLRHYPGSPLVAQALARERDRLVLCEKVPGIAAELRVGIGKTAPQLEAHAWVEVDGAPLNDAADVAARYPPFAGSLLGARFAP